MKWGFHIVNVFGKKARQKEKKYDTTQSDCWALARMKELNSAGISARVIRASENEPLCVVYKLDCRPSI